MNALHTPGDRFATILETAVVGILETDTSGVLVYANSRACEMLGRERDALMGRSVLELTDPSSVPESVAAIASVRAGNAGLTFRKGYLRGDGSVLAAETTINAIHNAQGETVGIMAILVDRTEQARAEQQLREREALQTYLLRLGDTLRPLADAEEIQAAAAAVIGEHLGASRILYAEVAGESDDVFVVRHDFRQPGIPPLVGEHRFDDFGRFIAREFRREKTLAIGNVRDVPELGHDELAIYDALSTCAFLAVPLVKGGRIVAYLAANQSTPRAWSAHDVAVIEETAERTWAAVQRAHAEAALHDANRRKAFQLQLSEAIRTLGSPDEIIDVAAAMLGTHLDATRVMYTEITGPDSALIRRGWARTEEPGLAGVTLTLSDFGPAFVEHLRAGSVVVNHDVMRDPRTARHVEAYAARGVGSELVIPVLSAGELKLAVSIHKAGPHRWQDSEVQLAQAVSQQILLAAEAATAATELRAERDLSRAIFDSMEEGLALFGPDWTIMDVNDIGARIAGRTRSEMVGRNHWEVLAETVGTPLEAMYRRVYATGVHETFEYLHEMPGLEPHWVEIRTYRIATGGLAVFFRDISDRKRIEQELNDAVRRRDEFLAMLAHELRNPLAPIRAAADVLSMHSIDEARIRKTSAIISRQVEHMTSLVDDLLDVSRVTRGLAVLGKERVNLKWAASTAVEQVRPLIEARRHHLTVQSPPGNADVSGDPKRLVQVLTNLLNNAAKYTPEGGHIALTIRADDEYVSVTVVDDGIGMSPEMTKGAFALFSQAEQTSDRTQGGLGIGLALVKSLVELHGGTVSATSAGTGAGSEFTVRLPRGVEELDPSRPTQEPVSHAAAAPLRVLIVDDNQDAASMLEMFLEACGHTVMTEHASREGLARALAERPDVCLLDIGLPGMDGNELARRIRSHPQTQHALLIAVTGYGQASDRQSTAAAGFDHHLVKPIEPSVLTGLLGGVAPR